MEKRLGKRGCAGAKLRIAGVLRTVDRVSPISDEIPPTAPFGFDRRRQDPSGHGRRDVLRMPKQFRFLLLLLARSATHVEGVTLTTVR